MTNQLGPGGYHPAHPEATRDPYAALAELRRTCPVSRLAGEDLPPVTLVTRYEDARPLYRNYKAFGNIGFFPSLAVYEMTPDAERTIIDLDPPRHTAVRRLNLVAMKPAAIDLVVPHIRVVADELTSAFVANGGGEAVGGARRAAPRRSHRSRARAPTERRSARSPMDRDAVQRTGRGGTRHARRPDPRRRRSVRCLPRRSDHRPTRDGAGRCDQPHGRVPRRGRDQLQRRRAAHPHPHDPHGGQRDDDQPDQQRRLPPHHRPRRGGADPSGLVRSSTRSSKSASAWTCRSPSSRVDASATEVLDGVAVAKDDVVSISIGSANRDEADWGDDADEFRVDRFASEQPDHLAFGLGVHFCVGAYLARATARVAIRSLLDHTSHLELAPDYEFDKVWFFEFYRPKRVDVVATPA